MKKTIKLFLLMLIVLLTAVCLLGCEKPIPEPIKVTFAQADGTVIALATADKDGKVYEPAVTPDDGLYIDGWYKTSTFSGAKVSVSELVFTENTTLYLKVNAEDYSVKYDLAYPNAQNVPAEATFNLDGSFVTADIPVRVGYRFLGWTDGNGHVYNAKTTVEINAVGDVTLVATWETQMLTVKFYDDVGSFELQTVPYNGNAVPPELPHTYSWCFELMLRWWKHKTFPGLQKNLDFRNRQ